MLGNLILGKLLVEMTVAEAAANACALIMDITPAKTAETTIPFVFITITPLIYKPLDPGLRRDDGGSAGMTILLIKVAGD